MDEIKMLSVETIDSSSLNPRKVVDPNSIIELSESIKSVGLLQPITVRLFRNHKSPEDSLYELVLGSRRLAACKLLGFTEIPAIIKDMDDNQTLEAMIVENLQRKDIEPIDEAESFRELIEKGYDCAHIALKVGKSEAFIRGRIKLNDLIKEFKDMLSANKLVLSNAYELCKIQRDIQEAIYEQHYAEGIDQANDWSRLSVSEIREMLTKTFYSLKDVDFDKTECNGCRFNTTTSSSLFNEYNENNCTNVSCYQAKKKNHLVEEINSCLNNDIDIMVVEGKEKTISQLKSLGVENPVLYNPSRVELVLTPEVPLLDEYEDEEQYKNDMLIYTRDMDGFGEKQKALGFKPAFTIGMLKSKIKYVFYKLKESVPLVNPVEENVPQEVQAAVNEVKIDKAEEISKLKKKDIRNVELMQEKIIEDTKKLIIDSDYRDKDFSLFDLEEDILFGCMFYLTTNTIMSDIKSKFDKKKSFMENIKALDSATKNVVKRAYIKQLIVSASVTSNIEVQEMLTKLSDKFYSEKYQTIYSDNKVKYDNQKERIMKRIDILENGTKKKDDK